MFNSRVGMAHTTKHANENQEVSHGTVILVPKEIETMTSNPQARLSIVAYRPKPGKEAELLDLSMEHVPYLRSIGLATDRPPVIARSSDGTVIEVFEWVEGGIEKAHHHPDLQKMWARYSAACDYVPLNSLPETSQIFANFIPVE
jgi:hypothetical protein